MCLTLVRNMDPLVRDMAVAGAKNAAAAAMQKAVAARMTGGQWSDLVQLVKDGEGQITAAVTDVGRVNELQAALAGDVIAALTAPNTADLGVPLGNLLPSPFFSGLGPKVPIRILSVSEVEVKLMSRFTSAGINQTLHRLLLTLSARVRVLIPTGTVTAIVYADVTAAETLIVGRVPDSYMYFEGSDQWDEPLEKYDILS
jgi:sporulation protein YunB